jgi:hypothetical protein
MPSRRYRRSDPRRPGDEHREGPNGVGTLAFFAVGYAAAICLSLSGLYFAFVLGVGFVSEVTGAAWRTEARAFTDVLLELGTANAPTIAAAALAVSTIAVGVWEYRRRQNMTV